MQNNRNSPRANRHQACIAHTSARCAGALHYLISYSKIVRAVSDEHLQPAPGSSLTIPPNDHCSVFDNLPAALRHGYQCGPVRYPKFSFDISSRSKARRCNPLPNHRNNRRGRDTAARSVIVYGIFELLSPGTRKHESRMAYNIPLSIFLNFS